MITIAEAAAALTDRLRTIPGLHVYDGVPDDCEYPAAFLTAPQILYESLSNEDVDPTFGIVVLVDRGEPRQQLRLYEYQHTTGTRSIPAALQADPSLGVTGVHAFVLASRSLDQTEI